MSQTMQKLGIDLMTPDERLRLIDEIWDSLEAGKALQMPQSHRQELDRRIAEADENPNAAIPWEEARGRRI